MYKAGKVVALYPGLGKGILQSSDRQLGKYTVPFYLIEADTDLQIGDTVSFLDNFFRASAVRKIDEHNPKPAEVIAISEAKKGDD